ncbi:MAG: aa3-type cytochrome c oxidase subunit IV [Pseudomonadota bacterium]
MDKAQQTYGGFMTAVKISVPVIAVIVFIVIMLIAG